MAETAQTLPQQTARMVSAFFDELIRGGVQDVVISPGSRSTALAMVAHASSANIYVDVDERGAAFFALGLAKANGRAVALVCTSGTALANYAPAVMEAESSRVPLMVLSGDRPARLQQLGAPQTFDQLKVFSDHVKAFWNMPQPSSDERCVNYARQIAREALIASAPGSWSAGPVHLNFPFDEPLKPDLSIEDVFACGRTSTDLDLPLVLSAEQLLPAPYQETLCSYLRTHTVIALCGEGTLAPGTNCDQHKAQLAQLCQWAHQFDIPLLADPLSGVRNCDDDAVVDCYDNIFSRDDVPAFDAVIRFGRYPVSKATTTFLAHYAATAKVTNIVVDPQETRDFNCSTTTFIKMEPTYFVRSLLNGAASNGQLSYDAADETAANNTPALNQWQTLNQYEKKRIEAVKTACDDAFEGSYISALIDYMRNESEEDNPLFFVANSMAIRAVDTFYNASNKPLCALGNRGLNGIDGTLSSALGAVQEVGVGALLTGDLTMLHDLNALALQNEMRIREQDVYSGSRRAIPSLTIVLLNNDGGAIFDMLPQQSSEPYFERLFLTPQAVTFEAAARAFDIPYAQARTVDQFSQALQDHYGKPGIHILEIMLPREGVRNRYQPYQGS